MPALSDIEEQLGLSGERKGLGAYYTPPEIVEGLLRLTLDPILADRKGAGPKAIASIRVLDPACGDGNFLVAVVERLMRSLEEAGAPPKEVGRIAIGCVVGVDLDDRAAHACRRRLEEVTGTATSQATNAQIWTADSLLMPHEAPLTLFAEPDAPTWNKIRAEAGAVEGFDLVIGNPPFLSQLHSETVFERRYAAELRDRFGNTASGYTEPAGLFLILGSQLLTPAGRLCLIEPISILASRSCGGIRSLLETSGSLEGAWFAQELVFADAAVDVWAPVFVDGSLSHETMLYVGPTMEEAGTASLSPSDGDSWSPLLAAVRGVPQQRMSMAGELGDVATATADFRDQYYGLVGAVVEHSDHEQLPKLITAGLIDPAMLLWGKRPTRFNKEEFSAPCVDLELLGEEMQSWARERLVPKVLVATQTRVLEAIVDENGELLPSVPVLTVESSTVDLWKIAALLSSPPISAVAARRHLGSALSSDALKLSARDVLALPLPADDRRWTSAASLFKQASHARGNERHNLLRESASEMCAAYGVEGPSALLEWWEQRLPISTRSKENT
ncbi:MAG: SAM-dependent DNA methyltransferase [Actinomycetia bacterium]|nr:SAM-dependent DNA methyltransferase [Actinomycetes bacterium]